MRDTIKKFIENQYLYTVACACTIIVYAGFLSFGHISWDDPEMVFKNDAVKNFDLHAFFNNDYVGNYLPVTMLVHGLSWSIFGASDAGHHLINLLIHLLNGFLVLRLGEKLFKEKSIANFGAIIFLLHPLQVESVGWISELKNVLSTSFFVGSLILYLDYLDNKKIKKFLFCFLLFVLACLSKPSAVVLPLCLFCVELFMNGKIKTKNILMLLPFLVSSIVFGLINIKAQTGAQFINHAHEFPIYQRIGMAGFALLKYLILFLVPIDLSIIYPYPEIKTSLLVVGYGFLMILFTGIILLFRQKNYQWLALILFLVCNLILVLQILPFGEVLYADRYLYVGMMGLGWIMGLLVNSIRLPYKMAGITLIVLFSVLTYGRSRDWKSAISLYEDIIKKYPTEYIALNSAGVECMFMNRDEKALEYFDRAIAVGPRNYKSYYNRGLLFLKNQKPEEAVRSFNETLRLYDYVKAYNGRASAYYMLNDLPKAISDARHALTLDAENAKAYFVLGNCYNDLNELDKAISEYNQAIRYNNAEADFYFKRAIAKGKQQNFKACKDDLEICLSLNKAYYEAYYWRGVAKVNLKEDPCPDLDMAARHNYEPAVIAYNKFCR